MKTFEEKFTAWIDGRLTGPELEEFEALLAKKEDVTLEKQGALKLGILLREHCRAPELENADFFNHQLMQRIESESARPGLPVKRTSYSWTPGWMAFAGAFCLAMAAAVYLVAVPKGSVEYSSSREYVEQILNAKTSDPSITATTFHTKDNKMTVLWLDGLEYIPSDTDQ